MLIGMAGPPGTGKSHVAQRIGRELGLPVLSVEAIVAAMWRAGDVARRRGWSR